MLDNIWNEAPALFSKAADMYDLLNQDDECFSDKEIIGEIERGTEDITSIISTMWGFDLKWDQTRQITHIKRKEFKKDLWAKNIGFGDDLGFPTVNDVVDYAANMEIPSVYQMVTYYNQYYQSLQEGLNYIGLDDLYLPSIYEMMYSFQQFQAQLMHDWNIEVNDIFRFIGLN